MSAPGPYQGYLYQIATGNLIPDVLVLHCHRAWLALLVVASSALLSAGLLAAVLEALRKGPDVLDYSTTQLRDAPFVDAGSLPSTEDAIEHARRLKKVKVVIGDSQLEQIVGHVTFGTTNMVMAMSRLDSGRRYA